MSDGYRRTMIIQLKYVFSNSLVVHAHGKQQHRIRSEVQPNMEVDLFRQTGRLRCSSLELLTRPGKAYFVTEFFLIHLTFIAQKEELRYGLVTDSTCKLLSLANAYAYCHLKKEGKHLLCLKLKCITNNLA